MKTMITISLTKQEAIYLTKILYDHCCDIGNNSENDSLLNELVDLLEVKPWDL